MDDTTKKKRCKRCKRLVNFVFDTHVCENCNDLFILIGKLSRSGVNYFYGEIQRRYMER
jgi:rRNA maturation endonuclease Nob1